MSTTSNVYRDFTRYVVENDPDRSITPSTDRIEVGGAMGSRKIILLNYSSYGYENRIISSGYFMKMTPYASTQSQATNIRCAPLKSSFESGVTWNTMPEIDYAASVAPVYVSSISASTVRFNSLADLKNALKYGIAVYADGNYEDFLIGMASSSPSYFCYGSITFDDTTGNPRPITVSPLTGSTVPKINVIRFSWRPSEIMVMAKYTQQSGTLYYKDGTSGEYTSVDVGTSEYYDLPANTLTEDTMQWYVSALYNYGTTRSSDTQTVSTMDSLSTAVAVFPKDTIIDGGADNIFRWTHINESGTAQTKAELQKSADGSVWETFKTVIGSVNNAVVSGDTFANGDWYWRVRTYNSDNVAGNWSDAVSLSVIGKPVTPTVTATSKPKPTVSWTNATGQQGYQIKVVGVYDSGTRYGTESSVSLPVILEDGSYTINFRIQNANGFWSDWASCSITVTNTGTESIPITATQSNSIVNIAWDDNDTSYTRFVVYRDGVAIYAVDALSGTGNDYSYNDIYVSGSHSYAVKALKASGDYDYSDDATVNATVDVLTLIDVESEAVLKLSLQTTSYSDISFTDSAISALMHITGADYPMIEVSRFRDKVVTFESAFKVGDANRLNLEALFGKSVCIKTSKGSVIVGCLVNSSKSETEFYISYTCQVSQINYGGDVEI